MAVHSTFSLNWICWMIMVRFQVKASPCDLFLASNPEALIEAARDSLFFQVSGSPVVQHRTALSPPGIWLKTSRCMFFYSNIWTIITIIIIIVVAVRRGDVALDFGRTRDRSECTPSEIMNILKKYHWKLWGYWIHLASFSINLLVLSRWNMN